MAKINKITKISGKIDGVRNKHSNWGNSGENDKCVMFSSIWKC